MLYLHCTWIYYGYIYIPWCVWVYTLNISMFQYFSSWIPWFGPFFVQTFSLFHISRGALSSGNGNTRQRVFFKSDFFKKKWEFWSFNRHWSFYLSTSELWEPRLNTVPKHCEIGKHCQDPYASGPTPQCNLYIIKLINSIWPIWMHLVGCTFRQQNPRFKAHWHTSTIAMIVHVPTAFWKILFRTPCRFGPTPIGYQGGTVSQGSLGQSGSKKIWISKRDSSDSVWQHSHSSWEVDTLMLISHGYKKRHN